MAGCSHQHIRDEAQVRLNEGNYEKAVGVLEDGLKQHPDSTTLRTGLLRTRTDALALLVSQASQARATGKLDEAQALLTRALAFDGTARVQSLLDEIAIERRHLKTIADIQQLAARNQFEQAQRLLAEALKDSPRNADLLTLQRRLGSELRERQVTNAQKGLAENRPISLDFRDAGLRAVLDAVSRHSGLNFVLDRDIRADIKISVFLRQARVEDAIDLIVSTNQLAKKVLDERTILVYPNTPEKVREHQELVVRVFYLASSDAKGAAAFLKSMLPLRDPFVDERINLLALRDSPQNIALAERLLGLYDGQEAEVLLEVEVLEVRSSRISDIGIKFPESFSLTPFPPAAAGAVGSAVANLTLGNIERLTRDDIRIGVGNTTVTLRRQVGDFNTLANPRIRARSREKAKVLIGDKVPIVTATTGQGGFVADSVSYLDVGLKLDVEPTVYADDDVAIRVSLEVSTIAREVRTASGSLAYQIGTRNASTLLRLRDGQTQLLAGLISREDRSSASRVPGVGDLPVMGRLFSSQSDDAQRTELVLAITPRIIRNVRPLEASESEIWIGTETQPRLRPFGGRVLAHATPTGQQPGGGAGQPSAAAGPNQAPGQFAGPGGMSQTFNPSTGPGFALGSGPASPTGEASQAAIVTARLRGPDEVSVGDTFVLTLDAQTEAAIRGGTLQFAYNKDRVSVVDVQEGGFLRQDGAATTSSQSIDAAQGQARLGLLRSSATGTSGSGTLARLRLKALAPGDAEIRLQQFDAVSMGAPITKTVLPTAFSVRIKP